MTSAPAVLAIVGPTASGKSALAMERARAVDGEIVAVGPTMARTAGADVTTTGWAANVGSR